MQATGSAFYYQEQSAIYNKLLTIQACLGCTGEYWPLVLFVLTSLRSVRTVITSGQYSSVWPSRSVSKRLLPFYSLKLPFIKLFDSKCLCHFSLTWFHHSFFRDQNLLSEPQIFKVWVMLFSTSIIAHWISTPKTY